MAMFLPLCCFRKPTISIPSRSLWQYYSSAGSGAFGGFSSPYRWQHCSRRWFMPGREGFGSTTMLSSPSWSDPPGVHKSRVSSGGPLPVRGSATAMQYLGRVENFLGVPLDLDAAPLAGKLAFSVD